MGELNSQLPIDPFHDLFLRKRQRDKLKKKPLKSPGASAQYTGRPVKTTMRPSSGDTRGSKEVYGV